ncbi:MAG TPA: IPT/TIG domain-containing protein, partial [Bacteroidota bacterium]|nr:IPT/TIG domain-containing protein [Bacteroidota bacterium]
WTWWEIEGVNTDAFDLMYVEISQDSGATWNSIESRGVINPLTDPEGQDYTEYSSGGLGQIGKWVQVYFDLTPYVGSTVAIRFRFDTIDNLYNGFRGWLIDDISVTSATLPGPTITSVNPKVITFSSGPATITGTNFVNGASVLVDSTINTGGGVLNSTSAQFAFPDVSAGSHSLTLRNPSGQSFTLANAFILSNAVAPLFGTISPDSALVGTAVPVTITGLNFKPGATVTIGGVAATNVQFVDTTQLKAVSPKTLAPGVYNVQIVNPDSLSVMGVLAFTVYGATVLAPQIISITPDSALLGTSVPITILGNHFHPGVTVYVGPAQATNVQLAADSTKIVAASPKSLAAGTYDVIVRNPDSLSVVAAGAFTVYGSAFFIAVGDSVNGTSQPFVVNPPGPVNSYISGVLYYRVAGTSTFTADTLSLSGSAINVSLPSSAITPRGVEYYVKMQTPSGGFITYPASTPDSVPAFFPVRVLKYYPPLPLTAMQYKMISCPLVLDFPSVALQLTDDYGAYNTSQWRVFRWQKGVYNEVPNLGQAFAPGYAFWLVTSDGSPFSLKRGLSVQSVFPYSVAVDTGWNQIANPFAFPVAWSNVTPHDSLTGPYSYDGTQYRVDTTVMRPFTGYFVYNSLGSAMLLNFQPIETNLASVAGKQAPVSLAAGEFVLQLSAQIPGTQLRDTYNYIGLRNGSSAGRDRFDAPKPPPIGDNLQVNILDGGSSYMLNFKPGTGQGQSWIFEVRTSSSKGKALLTVTPSGTLPAGYELHLLNLNDGNALPSATGTFEVDLDAPNSPHYYKVIMGTAAYVANERNGIPLLPVSYALEQNYPNPFNPSTTIRYGLAKRGEVTLEIYNALGQRVRTLVNAAQGAGTYEVVWNGTTDAGTMVASGVYFYRLRTESFTSVRKLIMIR